MWDVCGFLCFRGISSVLIGKECLLVCGILVGGDDVQVSLLSVGCLVAGVHGWFVVAFERAMFNKFSAVRGSWCCVASVAFPGNNIPW